METTRQYRDHVISLTEDLRFQVSGPFYTSVKPRECIFDALTDARSDIQKRLDEDNRAKAQNLPKLALKVVTDLGEEVTITRINRTSGQVDVQGNKYVFPAVPWLVEAVKRLAEIRQEMQTLISQVNPYEIAIAQSYGRIPLEDLPRRYLNLTQDYEAKAQKALDSLVLETQEN